MNIQYVQGKPIFTSINNNKPQFAYLDKNQETDVCIIGGGVTGCILGYYFSKKGIKSTILEKKRIAHLSTSTTTSLLQYELDDNANELSEITTLENVLKSYNLGLLALNEIDNFIKETGNSCNYDKKDSLLYTSSNNDVKTLEIEYEFRKSNGLDVDFIKDDDSTLGFDIKYGLISKNGGAQLDPFLYTHQLLNESVKNGLSVFENTNVIDIKYGNNDVTVITEYGYNVKCKKVIVATGYNTSWITKRNFGKKTTTFNVATKPIPNLPEKYKRFVVRDNNDPYNYFRSTYDNRLIIGGEDVDFIPSIFDKDKAELKYNILESRLKSLFKDINDIEIEYSYCGAFESTPDNLGFIGPDPKHNNLWYCLGYGANGILFAILGGMWLSDLYNGIENEDMKLFRVNRFDN